MPSLWSRYIKERLDQDSIEYDWGFVTYHIQGPICEVFDIYVIPEERKNRKAWTLADELTETAKQQQCNTLVGYIWPGVPGSDESMQALLAYGFKMKTNDGARIILTKTLEV